MTKPTAWGDKALAALVAYANEEPWLDFTIEEARSRIEKKIGEPHDLRAWGGVIRRAMRQKAIERTGSVRIAQSSNGSPKAVYRAVWKDGKKPQRQHQQKGTKP